MKWWTIVALFAAICAVFLGVGRTEETPKLDVLEEQPREDTENEEQLVDSFVNRENEDDTDDDDDDESENALDSEKKTPSDDEDEPSMFKRTPGRRRRRRRRRFRLRVRLRRLRLPRIRIRLRRIHDNLKNLCKKVSSKSPKWVQKACGFITCAGRDEEAPRKTNDETTDDVEKDSWLNEE